MEQGLARLTRLALDSTPAFLRVPRGKVALSRTHKANRGSFFRGFIA